VILDYGAAWFIEAAGAHLYPIGKNFLAHTESAAADWAKAAFCEGR